MKVANASLLALLLPAVGARFVEPGESDTAILYPNGLPKAPKDTQKYHIELSPGNTRWVTEDEKWELRRVSLASPQPLSSVALLMASSSSERQALLRHHRPPRARRPPRQDLQEEDRLP
jgi:hypothetical protein